MDSFVPSVVIIMIVIHMIQMKLISPPTAPGTIMFIAIVKNVIKILNDIMNLSMKLLKNGVDTNAFMAFFSD